ncbi:permease prefix domain 1-containing protein [Amnibacterium sp.]|uniref:permease prefix domain 1-containing protein n=1 Tax=Amnibacterium sp. TaxID=1872496 RepID=UPI00261C22D9|nr:permease prefix domain 1-containing protein [Amnibacterium sp.]MCU1472646.1 hypothetical protein [Amnibacterium sp.]
MSGALVDDDIAAWRAAVAKGGAVTSADADELEGHLRDQIADLVAAGLAEDEAFLVAVKRLGGVDAITAEFARAHSDRLWKQLALTHAAAPAAGERLPLRMVVFAAVAAVLLDLAQAIARLGEPGGWVLRDLGLFVLPVLAAYFAVARRIPLRRAAVLVLPVVLVAVVVNLYPFRAGGDSELLVAEHLPVLLWFVVGVAYLAGEGRSSSRRMDFVRFSGEWAIYFVLIALGGGVLVGLSGLVLAPLAPSAGDALATWVIPAGAGGAVVVAAWLVEAKKNVIENIAPVLTAIFTPLFALMLLAAVVVYGVLGIGHAFDRNLLIVFDALLLVVLALVLYGLSALDPVRPGGATDVVRTVAVVAALLLDLLVLGSMVARIGELGFTPNRVAALGLNVLLVVDLAVTAWLSVQLLLGRTTAERLERWQTDYLPVFGVWTAVVVLVLPPVFAFA